MVHKPCFTGFRGAQRDANKWVPDIEQPPIPLEMDESGNNDPCPEDEEFFDARPDAATMEEAISNFMDGIEAQERDGFKHLHQFFGRLPVPTVNVSPTMSLKDALEGGFLPSMTEEEQKPTSFLAVSRTRRRWRSVSDISCVRATPGG